MPRKLRVSVNPGLINKNETGNSLLFTQGWLNRELTKQELADEINVGRAYCAQLSGNRRSVNFLCSDVISVDIDGTRRIDELLADEFVRAHLSLFYTTPSHTEAKNRFRLVFAVARTITSAKDMVAASLSLTLRLRGDRSTTDAAHIFYGSRNSQPRIFDGEISEGLLDELILEGSLANQTDTKRSFNNPNPAPATTVSKLTVRADLQIRTASGEVSAFADLPLGATIHCPFHFDETASAFVLQSKAGAKGIRCSTCAKTFWPPNTAYTAHDFFDFETQVRRVHAYFLDHKDNVASEQGLLRSIASNDMFVHEQLTKSNIHLVNDRYLSLDSLQSGITFVKSPKGTGKTEVLHKLLAEDDSVLLIGHRVSLIGHSCARLNLVSYLDFHRAGYLSEKRLGICLDSLHRLVWKQSVSSFKSVAKEKLYKTIVIDESEQVLSHFLSATLEKEESGEYRNMRDLACTRFG